MKSWGWCGLFSVLFCALSFCPIPIRQPINDFLEDWFTHLSFRFLSHESSAKKYVVLQCPRLPVPETDDSFLPLADILRKLEILNPSVVILDTDPGVSPQSPLYSWLQGSFKDKMVLIAAEKGKRADISFQRHREESLTNAVFAFNQKKNLQIKNCVPLGGLPTAGTKAVQLLQGLLQVPEPAQKIRYFFGDGAYLRLTAFEFSKLQFQKDAFRGKTVLIRTGSFSAFDNPVLTSIGILSSETLLWNDMETLLQGGIKNLALPIQKAALIFLLCILGLLFIRLNVLLAFLGSFFILEAQLFIEFFLFMKGVTLDYFDFLFFPLFFLLVLLLGALNRVKKQAEAIQELEQFKIKMELRNKELFSLKKMSDLGKLSAGIFHEINNPLHNLFNALKLVTSENKLSEDSKDSLNLALEEVKRLQRLSQNLRRFYQSAPEETAKTIFVNEFLLFSLQMLRTSFNAKNVEVIPRLSPKNPEIQAVPDKLQQVFLNLLLNALDAVPLCGTVWVESDLKDEQILVTIRDSGPGISEEVRASIFEAFFTTKGEKGSGLGLYVSFEIVNSLGGDIEISGYKPGCGAEFIVKLPNKFKKQESL
jgi:signal transduction histidine kinase